MRVDYKKVDSSSNVKISNKVRQGQIVREDSTRNTTATSKWRVNILQCVCQAFLLKPICLCSSTCQQKHIHCAVKSSLKSSSHSSFKCLSMCAVYACVKLEAILIGQDRTVHALLRAQCTDFNYKFVTLTDGRFRLEQVSMMHQSTEPMMA